MDQATALLVLIFALGAFGKNPLIMATGLIALFFRLPILEPAAEGLQTYGIPIGLTILTLSVLAPLATGRIPVQHLMTDLISVEGITALAGGALAAWVCAQGVDLLQLNPKVVLGLMLGTIIGATFFKGIPVGPLFAAGLAAIFLFIARQLGL